MSAGEFGSHGATNSIPTSPLTGEASGACERSELAQFGGGAIRVQTVEIVALCDLDLQDLSPLPPTHGNLLPFPVGRSRARTVGGGFRGSPEPSGGGLVRLTPGLHPSRLRCSNAVARRGGGQASWLAPIQLHPEQDRRGDGRYICGLPAWLNPRRSRPPAPGQGSLKTPRPEGRRSPRLGILEFHLT